MRATTILFASCVLLGGCAAGGHCTGEFEYQQAKSLPAPPPVENLKTPEAASALRIPPPPAQAVPYAEYYPDPEDPEDQLVRCLDVPPALPPEPPPAQAPQG